MASHYESREIKLRWKAVKSASSQPPRTPAKSIVFHGTLVATKVPSSYSKSYYPPLGLFPPSTSPLTASNPSNTTYISEVGYCVTLLFKLPSTLLRLIILSRSWTTSNGELYLIFLLCHQPSTLPLPERGLHSFLEPFRSMKMCTKPGPIGSPLTAATAFDGSIKHTETLLSSHLTHFENSDLC